MFVIFLLCHNDIGWSLCCANTVAVLCTIGGMERAY